VELWLSARYASALTVRCNKESSPGFIGPQGPEYSVICHPQKSMFWVKHFFAYTLEMDSCIAYCPPFVSATQMTVMHFYSDCRDAQRDCQSNMSLLTLRNLNGGVLNYFICDSVMQNNSDTDRGYIQRGFAMEVAIQMIWL